MFSGTRGEKLGRKSSASLRDEWMAALNVAEIDSSVAETGDPIVANPEATIPPSLKVDVTPDKRIGNEGCRPVLRKNGVSPVEV